MLPELLELELLLEEEELLEDEELLELLLEEELLEEELLDEELVVSPGSPPQAINALIKIRSSGRKYIVFLPLRLVLKYFYARNRLVRGVKNALAFLGKIFRGCLSRAAELPVTLTHTCFVHPMVVGHIALANTMDLFTYRFVRFGR